MLGVIAGHDMTVQHRGRRFAQPPADGPRARPVAADGPRDRRRTRPAAAHRARFGEPHPDRVRAAGAVGAGQERHPARRPARRRRDDRHRDGGDARSHRAHAAPLRRRGVGRRERRQDPHHRQRRSRAARPRRRRAGRPELGGLPRRRGGTRAGLGHHHRGRARQSDAHRLLRGAARNGGRRRLHRDARGRRRAGRRHPRALRAARRRARRGRTARPA